MVGTSAAEGTAVVLIGYRDQRRREATTARGASPVRRALNIAPIMRPPHVIPK